MDAATYTCDECGYQAAEQAPVVEHLRVAHGITDAREVGAIEQRNGLLILHRGERQTLIDLDTWLPQVLSELRDPTDKS